MLTKTIIATITLIILTGCISQNEQTNTKLEKKIQELENQKETLIQEINIRAEKEYQLRLNDAKNQSIMSQAARQIDIATRGLIACGDYLYCKENQCSQEYDEQTAKYYCDTLYTQIDEKESQTLYKKLGGQ